MHFFFFFLDDTVSAVEVWVVVVVGGGFDLINQSEFVLHLFRRCRIIQDFKYQWLD